MPSAHADRPRIPCSARGSCRWLARILLGLFVISLSLAIVIDGLLGVWWRRELVIRRYSSPNAKDYGLSISLESGAGRITLDVARPRYAVGDWPPEDQPPPEIARAFAERLGKPVRVVTRRPHLPTEHEWRQARTQGSLSARLGLRLPKTSAGIQLCGPKGDRPVQYFYCILPHWFISLLLAPLSCGGGCASA